MKSKIIILSIFVTVLCSTSCTKWLDEQPLDQLSPSVFWKTEDDAKLALVGVYSYAIKGSPLVNNGNTWSLIVMSDDGIHKAGRDDRSIWIRPEDPFISGMWQMLYRAIHKENYFLANIDAVTMDATKKAQYKAEVKFMRAYSYFMLTQWWGDVPLIKNVISIEEANTLSRTPQKDVVAFVLSELTSVAADLPISRPASEKGRIVKAAALAYKGKLLMAEKRWTEAAATFKEIIDLNVYEIDPKFKDLFEVSGESSKEIIFSKENIAGIEGNGFYQVNFTDQFYGGYSQINPFQETVDAFLMKDGLPIESSPLYDPNNEFDNRDPRLYASILLPNYSIWNGIKYQQHPDSTINGVKAGAGRTGYGLKKFTMDNYKGDGFSSGADQVLVRYAEVLLSYLESKLEAGDGISQALLNETINKVRGRSSVGMPAVTITDPTLLREIVRRERRVEFFGEQAIRLWDITRWKIANTALRGVYRGMKVTNTPATYTAYKVDAKGYLIISERKSFNENINYLWPLPLSELDINKNLKQNPGY